MKLYKVLIPMAPLRRGDIVLAQRIDNPHHPTIIPWLILGDKGLYVQWLWKNDLEPMEP